LGPELPILSGKIPPPAGVLKKATFFLLSVLENCSKISVIVSTDALGNGVECFH